MLECREGGHEPVHEEAGLHHRQVEAPAVVGHDGRRPLDTIRNGELVHERVNGVQERALLAEAAQEVLPREEVISLEPPAAHEEGVRAGAPAEARGFEVEEERCERPRGPRLEQPERLAALPHRLCEAGNRLAPVRPPPLVGAFHDEARPARPLLDPPSQGLAHGGRGFVGRAAAGERRLLVTERGRTGALAGPRRARAGPRRGLRPRPQDLLDARGES